MDCKLQNGCSCLEYEKTSGKSVYETLWKLRKVVTSWLALPQWHGVCDEAWQVLSLPENMREPHPTHRSWKTSVLMYMVKLRWINMGYRHPTSIFIGFPWIPLWVYEPDRGWSHNPRDFGFDWPYHWLATLGFTSNWRKTSLPGKPSWKPTNSTDKSVKIYRWLSPVRNRCQPHIHHFNPFHDTFS